MPALSFQTRIRPVGLAIDLLSSITPEKSLLTLFGIVVVSPRPILMFAPKVGIMLRRKHPALPARLLVFRAAGSCCFCL